MIKINNMKNIFLLSTDKPSRLFIDIDDNKLKITKPLGGEHMMNQHIYITSDEEIKEGDWVITNGGLRFVTKLNNDKIKSFIDDGTISKQSPSPYCRLEYYKKIILTTDKDLIKDGVQAIDDNFLEWFVKNPSREEVKIIKVCSTGRKCDGKGKNCNVAELKIIIPQQEPKLTNNCPKCGLDLIEREGSKPYCTDIDCGGIILSNETLREFAARKQESVEAAARKLLYEKYPYHHPKYGGYFMDMFIEGAKWAEERTNK